MIPFEKGDTFDHEIYEEKAQGENRRCSRFHVETGKQKRQTKDDARVNGHENMRANEELEPLRGW